MNSTVKGIATFLAEYGLGMSLVLVAAGAAGYAFLRWRRYAQRHYTPAEWKHAFDYAFAQRYPRWLLLSAEGSRISAQFMACKHKLEQEWAGMRTSYRVGFSRLEDLRYQAGMKIRNWRCGEASCNHPPVDLDSLYRSWEEAQLPGLKSA